jgi:hypothetical protein
MRRIAGLWLSLALLGVIGVAAQRGDEDLLGTWSGTWEGAGSGGFELTLEKSKDGPMTGRVSVTGEPTYKATLKTLTIDGKKMSATYDFPPDEGAEVVLAATFDANKADGTWQVREKANGNVPFKGTWTVTRK